MKLIQIQINDSKLEELLQQYSSGATEQYLCCVGRNRFVSGVYLANGDCRTLPQNCSGGCLYVDSNTRFLVCVPLDKLDAMYLIDDEPEFGASGVPASVWTQPWELTEEQWEFVQNANAKPTRPPKGLPTFVPANEALDALQSLYEEVWETDPYPTSDEHPLYQARELLQKAGRIAKDGDDDGNSED